MLSLKNYMFDIFWASNVNLILLIYFTIVLWLGFEWGQYMKLESKSMKYVSAENHLWTI